MKPRDRRGAAQKRDKQLRCISLESVLKKRRLDQALNAKEFAVCAGVSYSTARNWFRMPGFPCCRGVVFWQDFVQWRISQNGFQNGFQNGALKEKATEFGTANLPSRAAQILREF